MVLEDRTFHSVELSYKAKGISPMMLLNNKMIFVVWCNIGTLRSDHSFKKQLNYDQSNRSQLVIHYTTTFESLRVCYIDSIDSIYSPVYSYSYSVYSYSVYSYSYFYIQLQVIVSSPQDHFYTIDLINLILVYHII